MWTPVGYTLCTGSSSKPGEPPLQLTNWSRVRCYTPLMANQTLSSDIRRYALAGAQARLAEISLELEAIRRAFPELRENGSSGARTRQSAVTGGDEPTTPRTPPPQHHVRRPAQGCRRADEEVLGSTPGRNCNNGCRGRRSKRDSEGQGSSSRQRRQTRSCQARPPQDVRRRAEADFAGAEEAVGGETEGRLSGYRPRTKRWGRYGMKPDEVAKLVLDIERSVQMRTMLRQKLATNQEVDLVEEWNEIEQLDLEIARKIRKAAD